MHQRSCKTFKSLQESNPNDRPTHDPDSRDRLLTETIDPGNPESDTVGDSDSAFHPDEHPEVLPGVKLPRTKSEWEEANTYFQLTFDWQSPILDIDSFVSNLQLTLYKYFAENYGTTVDKNGTSIDEYNSMSVKDLKKMLKLLK